MSILEKNHDYYSKQYPYKDQMKKALVCFTIEQTLLEIGGMRMLSAVNKVLEQKYQCKIVDCYENPQFFHETIKYLFQDLHTNIIKKINDRLEDFIYPEQILEFIEKTQK